MERVATRALDITHSMQKEQARLHAAHLEILQIQQSCPTLRHNTTANSSIPWELSSLNTTTLKETIHATLVQVNFLVDTNVQNAQTALVKVKEATQSMDQAINVFKANEWKPKLCMVVLVVVNIFFIVGVILSRNNVAYNPYQCVAAYVLIPTFCTCLLLMALGTYGFGAGAVANADFCAGGQYESYPSGSPVGTIEEIMKQQGVSPNDVVYQSYQYYVNVSTILYGCIAYMSKCQHQQTSCLILVGMQGRESARLFRRVQTAVQVDNGCRGFLFSYGRATWN